MDSRDYRQKCQKSQLHRSYTHNTKYRYTHKCTGSILQLGCFNSKHIPKKKEKFVFPIPSSKSDIIWDSLGRFRKHKVHFRSFQYWSFCMYIYKSVYGLMTWPLTNSFNVWLCMAMSVYRTIGIRYLHLLECTPY